MTSAKRFLRLALATFLVAVLGIWALSSGTLSSFKKAQLTNSTSSLKSALLAYQHSYGTQVAPQTCSGNQSSTSPVACSGSLYASNVGAGPTDTITNTGTVPTSRTTASAQLASCGAVQLANSVGTTAPLLPRNGTTFTPTATAPWTGWAGTFGNIALAGNGYASAAVASTEPSGSSGVVATANYGLGIWFNTTMKSVPLFGFGADPGTGTGSNDRILYLDSNGRLAFIPSLTATAISSTSTTPSLSDGSWHYAYVVMTVTTVTSSSVSYAVKIYADGVSVAGTTTNLTGSLSSYSGYWHVGEAPLSGKPAYFIGSLAGFLVDDSGNAPTSLTGKPTTYKWDNAASVWPMNDSGATTYTNAPFGLTTPVCGQLDIVWNAAGASTTPRSMTNASTTGTTFTAPAPNATTTLTVTTSHDATYNAAIAGLIVYAPITITFTSGTAPWSVAFTWTTTPTSTFVVS